MARGDLNMLGRHAAVIFSMTLALGSVAVRASADEGGQTVAAPASLSTVFQGAARRAATAPAVTGDHIFGVGLRVGGSNFGVGATLRYFPNNGPFGFQAEVSHFGIGAATLSYDYSSTQFNGEVLYRLNEIKLDAPLKLQPYAGGGVSVIHTSFPSSSSRCHDNDPLALLESCNSTGVVVTGGVELFFDQVPRLGVSGAFEFTSNGDFSNVSLGGPAFMAAAHWYFK